LFLIIIYQVEIIRESDFPSVEGANKKRQIYAVDEKLSKGFNQLKNVQGLLRLEI
jgi:hypothetical protein